MSRQNTNFEEFEIKKLFSYVFRRLSPHVRVLRVPDQHLRSLDYEPYEFTYEAREISENSDWNELIQFALRKMERFVKSNVIELEIPDEFTEGGRYAPQARFIDEISDEIDVIEDKKAPLLCE
jgi:hypothetical protein